MDVENETTLADARDEDDITHLQNITDIHSVRRILMI